MINQERERRLSVEGGRLFIDGADRYTWRPDSRELPDLAEKGGSISRLFARCRGRSKSERLACCEAYLAEKRKSYLLPKASRTIVGGSNSPAPRL